MTPNTRLPVHSGWILSTTLCVMLGACGMFQGERGALLGGPGAYQALEVGDEGRASGRTTLDVAPESGGSYHVVVYASPTNRDLTIACGNLAPPSN